MKNGQTRVFTENGIHYAFNSQAFRSRIDSMARERSISKGKITDELADALSVTPDAINNWKYGKNGPADLDTINQEYFDLHNHEIYDELCEFASEDLTNVYNGKVSYAYRFEADGEHDPTVWQDYEKAMQHLNEIIERYV